MGVWILIPILNCLIGVVGFWSVYGIDKYYNTHNSTEQFPYISDCGDKPPASCWFSQVCNFCCILALIFEVLRFKNNQLLPEYNQTYNIASFVLGIISALGLSITGNFQVSAVKVFHYIGATLAFIVGLIYLWIQLWLIRERILTIVGLILIIIWTILFFFFLGFHFRRCFHVAAILEWTLATTFFFIYPLFVVDFAKMKFSLTVTTVEKTADPEDDL